MNWLFNFILYNNILQIFVPKKDIDEKLDLGNKFEEKPLTRGYYEDLSNIY